MHRGTFRILDLLGFQLHGKKTHTWPAESLSFTLTAIFLPLSSLVFICSHGGRPEPGTHQEPGSSLPWHAHLCSLGEETVCTIHHLLCSDPQHPVLLCFLVAGIYHLPFSSHPPAPFISATPRLLPKPLTVKSILVHTKPATNYSILAQGEGMQGSQLIREVFWGPISVLTPLSWK